MNVILFPGDDGFIINGLAAAARQSQLQVVDIMSPLSRKT